MPVVMTDAERYADVVAECAKSSADLLAEVRKFKSFATDAKSKTQNGISFYDGRNTEMLAYLADMAALMSKMGLGESISSDPSVDRLIRRRIVLDKMRPIEGKLRTQVDRLMGTRKGPSAAESAPSLRARPDQFVIDDGDDEDEDEEDDDQKPSGNQPRKYVPPKIRALQFEGDEQDKAARRAEKTRKRALQTTLIKDLRTQYSMAPEEIVDEFREKESFAAAERRRYEEEHMVRLQVTKRQMAQEKRKQQLTDLDTLLNFGDYMGSRDEAKPRTGGRKRKFPGGPKGGKKGGAKKFKKAANKGKRRKK